MSSKILRLTATAGATALLAVGGTLVAAGTASAATAPTTMTIAAHHHHHDHDNLFDCRWVQTHEDPDEGFALFCHEEHHHHHHDWR